MDSVDRDTALTARAASPPAGPSTSAAEELFAGPGEMRAYCRAYDWTATPVGPVERWPAALRAAVQQCLDCGFPVSVHWGPDQLLFYNDAYRVASDAKHPWTLGRPAREVWPEMWEQLAPQYAQALAGRSLFFPDRRYDVERDGQRATMYWTYSLSPLRDDRGAVVGLQTIGLETTARYRAEAALADELRAMTRLQALSSRFVGVADLGELLERILDAAIELHGADFGNIQLYDADTKTLRIAAHRGFGRAFLEHFAAVNPSDGSACGMALAGRHRVDIEDVEREPGFAPSLAIAREAGYRAVQSTPMYDRSGTPLGMISTHFRAPHRLSEREIRVTEVLAQLAQQAILRTRAEAALRETRSRLDAALATARMANWQWDLATGATIASSSMDDLFGLRPGEHFGTATRFAFVHAADLKRYRALVQDATARGAGWHSEFRVVRPRDGAVVWLEEHATATRDPATGAAHASGMVWDVTDRKRAEAAAERERVDHDRDTLRVKLTLAEEEERRRLARELHDEAGQHLTALVLGLQALADVAPPHSEIDRRAAELRALANTLAVEMHAVAVRLRPRALDDFGLEAALVTYAEEWSRRSGIAVDVHARAHATRLPSAIESAVYRIVQEALTNVARHSGAARVGVVLERRNGYVVAVVEDEGNGFDADALERTARDTQHLGLLGIRERATLLGGTAAIESTPGRGTTVLVRIPVDGPAAAGGSTE